MDRGGVMKIAAGRFAPSRRFCGGLWIDRQSSGLATGASLKRFAHKRWSAGGIMRSRKLVAMFACFIVLVTAPLAYAQTLPSSQSLGLKPGRVQSFARDVSASGSVVIGTYWVADPPGVRQLAFRWEAGTFQDFETLNPNARGAQGRAVSNVGSEI